MDIQESLRSVELVCITGPRNCSSQMLQGHQLLPGPRRVQRNFYLVKCFFFNFVKFLKAGNW